MRFRNDSPTRDLCPDCEGVGYRECESCGQDYPCDPDACDNPEPTECDRCNGTGLVLE